MRMRIFGKSLKLNGFFRRKYTKSPKLKLSLTVPKFSPNICRGCQEWNPKEISKIDVISVPKRSQKLFKACPHPYPFLKNQGLGQGSPGIGVPFPHTIEVKSAIMRNELCRFVALPSFLSNSLLKTAVLLQPRWRRCSPSTEHLQGRALMPQRSVGEFNFDEKTIKMSCRRFS